MLFTPGTERLSNMSEMVDFYIDGISITSLFSDYSEGNAELHDLFEFIYVPMGIANSIMKSGQSIKHTGNYRFLHRDVYNRECGDFVCRLIASADGFFSDCQTTRDSQWHMISGTAMINILSNGRFIASCPLCASKINTFLDVGCIDVCKHELALLLGLDYYMSLNNKFNVTMRAKRLEAIKMRRARLERIKGIDHKKLMALCCGVTSIEKDFITCTLHG